MATINPQTISAGGTALTLVAAAAGGDSIANAKGVTVVVKNGDTGPHTVTFAGVVPCSQGGTHPVAVAVAAGAEEHIPVPSQSVNPTSGAAAITYDAVTALSIGAHR